MFSRYFLGRGYRITDAQVVTVPVTFADEPVRNISGASRPVTMHTLTSLCADVLARLGDNDASVWTANEVQTYLRQGYHELALSARAFWDQAYLENQTPGFSCTAAWEVAYLGFDYGVANYTLADERHLEDEGHRIGWGNHTCPAEAFDGWLSDCAAAAVPEALAALPADCLEVERVTWDDGTLTALSPTDVRLNDTRYQNTRGEVLAFVMHKDGLNTLRKIRVPSASADVREVTGTWGSMRDATDFDSTATTATWGVPRRVPGEHPLGSQQWGIARRPHQDGKNLRIEYWREGRDLDTPEGSELPAHYGLYLRHYAMGRCLARNGPGQDDTLAKYYQARWARDLERIARRRTAHHVARRRVLGERDRMSRTGRRPPRPAWPANYEQG